MTLSFSKYHGTGNDFILIDDRDKRISLDSSLIQKLCHRQYGVGADGVILLRSGTERRYAMQIFNSDGSEAEMCGNGLRCLVRFLKDLGETGDEFLIETWKKNYACTVNSQRVTVEMGIPKILEESDEGVLLEVGVPHFVTFTDDLSQFDLEARARFSDLGVNINYATLDPLRTLTMRTFERGVEEETFSCGSGATAVCMAAWHRFGLTGPVKVVFGSGEQLEFNIATEHEALVGITMSGDTYHVYNGDYRQ